MTPETLREFVFSWTFGIGRLETETYAEKLKVESNLEFAQAVALRERVKVLELMKRFREAMHFTPAGYLSAARTDFETIKTVIVELDQLIAEAKK